MTNSERFPEEIASALDALGEKRNRQLLTQLWDTDLIETALSDEDIERLDSLKTAGLANKQIYQQTENGIVSKYSISTYGKRFVRQLFGTLGQIVCTDSET